LTKQTETATFRLHKTMVDKLRTEAKEKQISVSTLLDQIVRAHIEWHANAPRAGFIPIRRGVIKRLFDLLTKEQIEALANDVSRGLTEETMMIMTSERTEESIFALLERWIRVAGFDYRYEVDGKNNRIFVVHHNMGEKWSLYLSHLLEHVALEFMNAKPDTQITENALFVKMEKI
jgi:hypothetical protein